MAILSKIVYYDRTYEQFKTDSYGLNNATQKDNNGNWGNIKDTAIVFLGDGNIWTHGKLIKASGLANPIQITFTNGTYQYLNKNIDFSRNTTLTLPDTSPKADALTSNAGTLHKPVYFSNGIPVQCSLHNDDIADNWLIDFSPTSVTFNGDWVKMNIDLNSGATKLSNGIYLLCIIDSGIIYSGTFSFYSGTINTDEEIILHACGTRQSYTENGKSYTEGIIYAKIKPGSDSKPALYLAHNQHITNNKLQIKIKKLASL